MRFDFLLCSIKSGSNLITKIMNGHPEIYGAFPSHILRFFALNHHRYGDLHVDANWERFLEDVVYHLNHMFTDWSRIIPMDTLKQRVTERTLAEVYRIAHEYEAEAHGKSRVFIKEVQVHRYAGYVLSRFPDAKYVFMVRDPRDMALWWKQSAPDWAQAMKTAARTWAEDQLEGIRLYSQLRETGKAHYLTFERLLQQPEREIATICEFLDVPYSDKMLEFYSDDLVIQNSKKMYEWIHLREPLRRDNFNNYLEGLSEAEIRYVESVCWEVMPLFGYEPHFSERTPLEQLEDQVTDTPAREVVTSDEEKEAYRQHYESVARIESRTAEPLA
jgi:hypothetical protein